MLLAKACSCSSAVQCRMCRIDAAHPHQTEPSMLLPAGLTLLVGAEPLYSRQALFSAECAGLTLHTHTKQSPACPSQQD